MCICVHWGHNQGRDQKMDKYKEVGTPTGARLDGQTGDRRRIRVEDRGDR